MREYVDFLGSQSPYDELEPPVSTHCDSKSASQRKVAQSPLTDGFALVSAERLRGLAFGENLSIGVLNGQGIARYMVRPLHD